MMQSYNPAKAFEHFYKDLDIVLRTPKTKASSRVELLKSLEFSYGLILDPLSEQLMDSIIDLYQEWAASEVSDQMDVNTVNRILHHIKIWNGAPMEGMLEFIMSGRNCESLQQNLENYPFARDETFYYLS